MAANARAVAQALGLTFYRCPNNGRILEGYPGDDKVICNCGQPNPVAPSETVHNGLVHHRKASLPTSTLDAYITQGAAPSV